MLLRAGLIFLCFEHAPGQMCTLSKQMHTSTEDLFGLCKGIGLATQHGSIPCAAERAWSIIHGEDWR